MKPSKTDLIIDKPVSWKKMLDAVPVRNAAAVFELLANDTTKVTVLKKKPGWLVPPLSWIFRPRLKKSVVLDPVGIRICEWCDGKRTVENIVDEFAGLHGLTFHESRTAVTGYLGLLVRYGILAMKLE